MDRGEVAYFDILFVSLNLEVEITAMERIMEQGLVIARAGELFARVPLTDQLNEDTDAGKEVEARWFIS